MMGATFTLVALCMGATSRLIIADRRERSCAECNNEVRGTLVVSLDLHG